MDGDKKGTKWTDEEVRYLKMYYPKKGALYVSEKLNRSKFSVAAQARKHKLFIKSRRDWSAFEDTFLRRHYLKKTCASIGRSLKRSKLSIALRAHRLGLNNGQTSRSWLPEEVLSFIKLYPLRKNSLEQLAKIFNRTIPSLVKQARKLGIKRPRHANTWTEEQHDYLVKNIKKKSYKEIAEHLGIPSPNVFNHCKNFNLQKPVKFRRMTQEEKDYIINNYHKLSARQIGEKLGRSVGAIRTYAATLGVAYIKGTTKVHVK